MCPSTPKTEIKAHFCYLYTCYIYMRFITLTCSRLAHSCEQKMTENACKVCNAEHWQKTFKWCMEKTLVYSLCLYDLRWDLLCTSVLRFGVVGTKLNVKVRKSRKLLVEKKAELWVRSESSTTHHFKEDPRSMRHLVFFRLISCVC